MLAYSVVSLAPNLGGELAPEARPPVPYRLVADVDAALVQQVLDVAQRQRVADVQQHHQPGNFHQIQGEGLSGLRRRGMAAALTAINYRPVHLE